MQAKAPGAVSDVRYLPPSRRRSLRARVVCARAARFHDARVPRTSGPPAYPLRRFSRRRKNRPTPVHLLERRRRIGRGDHSPLPREAALGQFSGRPIVEAVVRRLADGNQIPAAPLPAWEVVHRIDMVDSGRRLVAAVAAGFTALVAIASQNRIPQMQPAFALVVHLQSSPFHVSAEGSARRGGLQSPRPVKETTCLSGFRPAQPSEENKKAPRPHDGDHGAHAIRLSPRLQNKKRQTIYRSHGQIIWRWRWHKGSGSGSYSRVSPACTACSTAGSPSATW